jgi:hypothetical protein
MICAVAPKFGLAKRFAMRLITPLGSPGCRIPYQDAGVAQG